MLPQGNPCPSWGFDLGQKFEALMSIEPGRFQRVEKEAGVIKTGSGEITSHRRTSHLNEATIFSCSWLVSGENKGPVFLVMISLIDLFYWSNNILLLVRLGGREAICQGCYKWLEPQSYWPNGFL